MGKHGKKGRPRGSTPMQERFVLYVLAGEQQTRAARLAGYSEKSAASQAVVLMNLPQVQAAIEAGRAKQRRLLEAKAERRTLTLAGWLEELAEIAEGDMDEHQPLEAREIPNGKGGTRTITQARVIPSAEKRRGATRAIKKITQRISKAGIETSIELHSKQQALELIGRHRGWAIPPQDGGGGLTPPPALPVSDIERILRDPKAAAAALELAERLAGAPTPAAPAASPAPAQPPLAAPIQDAPRTGADG